MKRFKLFLSSFATLSLMMVSACSTNPATGQRQFTALMSPQQENQIGAQEHEKIIKQFGLYDDERINAYVEKIGQEVTRDTERPDVNYKFFVLDSPIVNAFALPGGYIYISRGLLALANSEAEVAAVLAHEAGHITGRHSAERYSHGVLTSLGAGILSAVIDSAGAAQALGTGANLYLSSYSRSQENEADSLGLRYMTRGGYHPDAMPAFLDSLRRQSDLDAQLAGRSSTAGANYFSTHPATQNRVNQTQAQAQSYARQGQNNRDQHLKMINGMVYGNSASQGFERSEAFYHPEIGFTFDVADGLNVSNQPSRIVASSKSGSVVIFDMASNKEGVSPQSYLKKWMKDRALSEIETPTVHGRRAATASFESVINNRPTTIRIMAIDWVDAKGVKRFARFQVGIPQGTGTVQLNALKAMTYSFRSMTAKEQKTIKPIKMKIFTANADDSVLKYARKMPFDKLQEQRFKVLNALKENEQLLGGRQYKLLVD